MTLCQVPQIFLPCASRHGAKLIRLVGCVLGVDDFAQQEVPEDGGLGEGHALGDWWAEGGNVLGTGDGHTADRRRGEEGVRSPL